MFNPFDNKDLVQHLLLDKTHSIQYLDKASSKWITFFRTSPSIAVNKGATLHVKGKDNPLSVMEVFEEVMDAKREDLLPVVKVESVQDKKRLQMASDVIDLTMLTEERTEKRMRLGMDGASSPTRKGSPIIGSREGFDVERGDVGFAPAKLSKFPAKTVGEMDRRLQWITNAEGKGTLESKYKTVFSCKYVGSSYHNHRNAWLHLKDTGVIPVANSSDDWLPLYSKAWKEMGAARRGSQLQSPAKKEIRNEAVVL